jgi:hypothetical protein
MRRRYTAIGQLPVFPAFQFFDHSRAALHRFHKIEELPQSASTPLIVGKAHTVALVDAEFLKLARTLRFQRCGTPLRHPKSKSIV